jgi:hypothetical protein
MSDGVTDLSLFLLSQVCQNSVGEIAIQELIEFPFFNRLYCLTLPFENSSRDSALLIALVALL